MSVDSFEFENRHLGLNAAVIAAFGFIKLNITNNASALQYTKQT